VHLPLSLQTKPLQQSQLALQLAFDVPQHRSPLRLHLLGSRSQMTLESLQLHSSFLLHLCRRLWQAPTTSSITSPRQETTDADSSARLEESPLPGASRAQSEK
jgi:hypothetical protein